MVLMFAADASAQLDRAARDRARPLAEKGFLAYRDGRYADAVELFQQAESEYHAPSHVLFIARGLQRLGRLVEAQRSYHALISERLPDYAPEQFHEAQREGRSEAGELDKRVPRLLLRVQGAGAGARLSIDGAEWQALRDDIALDPGEHDVAVKSDDGREASQRITLAEGARRQLVLTLPRAPHDEPVEEAPSLVEKPVVHSRDDIFWRRRGSTRHRRRNRRRVVEQGV